MKQKLKTEAGQAINKMRKAIVELVFGQIKKRRRFRRCGLRGLEKVSATHTLSKLFCSGWNPKMARKTVPAERLQVFDRLKQYI
jgi:hypothetical protein